MDPRNNENFYLLINALVSLSFVLGIGFYLPAVIILGVNQVISVDESAGAVDICARIAEGFIERESNIIIALTAVEFQNEATLCK